MSPEEQRLEITIGFVAHFSRMYDVKNRGKRDAEQEKEILEWLRNLPEPKYLDWEHFQVVAKWKSPRPSLYYEQNSAKIVEGVTRLAYQEPDSKRKIRLLTGLMGVNVPVAATLLYFLHSGGFPIFDVRARTTLKRAGLWKRRKEDASIPAWLEYLSSMGNLSQKLNVTLRELDKALYMYDAEGAKNP